MDMLNERIVKDGVCIGTEIVKVDSFLNHQIDVELLDKLGKKFSEIFSDVQVDKILKAPSYIGQMAGQRSPTIRPAPSITCS